MISHFRKKSNQCYLFSTRFFDIHVRKNNTETAANAAPTKPICEICPLSHTIPPRKLPAPIPKLKIPEKIDIATDEDCSSVHRIVSDWNDTLNTSTEMPHKAQSPIINPGCHDAASSNNSSTANEIITVSKNACLYLS